MTQMMLNDSMTLTLPSDLEIVITRTFAAPRRLVFEAWTTPEYIKRWWGISRMEMILCEVDLRAGGAWRYVSRQTDGTEIAFSGVYQEILPYERLVYSEMYEAMPEHGYTVTLTLDEQAGVTTLTGHMRYQTQEARDGHLQSGMEAGVRETYESLDVLLMSEQANPAEGITITRIFDAPRALVWKAWTNPEHVMRWWGPKDYTSPTCQIDLREGGKYVFSMRGPDGQDMYSGGIYNEIVPMERLVCTDSFTDSEGNLIKAADMGMPADFPDEFLVIISFEDAPDGKTKMTLKHVGLPAGEMTQMTFAGWNQSFDKMNATFQ